MDGTTVNLNGNITLETGTMFELASGSVTGTNTFLGPGGFVWSGGSLTGSMNIAANANLSISGSADKSLTGAVLNNAASAAWTGTGTLFGYNGAALTNTGRFAIQTDAALSYCCGGQLATFINLGTVTKMAGGGTNICNFIFNNNGLLNVQAGALALAQGGNSSGIFSNALGAKLEFSGSTHTLNAEVLLSGAGPSRINGGTVALNGDINLGNGTTLELAVGQLQGAGALKGTGTFAWTGVGTAVLAADTSIAAGGSWKLSGTGANMLLSGGHVLNAGAALWTGSGDIVGYNGATITNLAVFEMQNDQTFTYCCGGAAATFANLPGAVLRKNIATGVTSFGNFLLLNGGVVDIQSGLLSLTSVTHSFAGGSDLRGLGRIRVDGTTVNLNGNITLETGTMFELASGTVTGTNTFVGPGTFVWSGGSLTGSMNIAANANLSISGTADKNLNGAALNNAGTSIWTGTGNLIGFNGAAITNSGLFELHNDAALDYCCGGFAATFYNQAAGTLRKTLATGTTTIGNFNFTNNGTVDLSSGVLALAGGYAPSPASQLRVALGGQVAGTQFSQLNLGGAAALAGTLNVSLANGFSPTNGSSFAIMNYGSLTTQFSAQQLPALSFGRTWKLDYGPRVLTLRVQPFQGVQNTGWAPNGTFGFDITGVASRSATVLVSTNFVRWDPIFTNAPFTGSFQFSDPASHEYPPVPIRVYWVSFQP